MIQLLVTLACLVLATATNAANATSYESNSNSVPRMTTNDELMLTPDTSYPTTLAELNLPSDQADRIRSAMAKFFVTPNQAAGLRFVSSLTSNQLPESRIRTRSAPTTSASPELQDIRELLNSIDTDHEKAQRSINHQQQQQSGIGHKSLRNIQPVFMRLPPRFGKRSIY